MCIRLSGLYGLIAAVLMMTSTSVNAAQATATVTAEIITPVSIQTTQFMAFGRMQSGNNGGQVTVSTDDSRSSVGSVELASSSATAARFMINGHANATYAISLPTQTTLQGSQGSVMTVSQYQSYPATTGQLDNSGQQELRVGGTLQVAPEQQVGLYAGEFTVVVDYN